MTGRNALITYLILSTLALILLMSGIIAEPARAQEGLPEGISMPNYEASSRDTLMERTDMGNTAQEARMQYSSGARELNKALKLRQKAAKMTDPEARARTLERAQGALDSADKAFRETLSYDADLIEAYAGLGTVLRLQGKPQDALQVHAMALRKAPNDLENFTGWTDSLMALNMLGNATTAYTDYAQSNPQRAEILMTAIEKWLADKKTDPGDLDPGDVQRLADWVEQQKRS